MRKMKKALASLAIAGMVLSMAPASIFAADDDTRLAGSDRYQTSIKIAEKAYSSATTAVVAAGNPNNLVDALAAAPLAAQENAPIYLTDKADMNNDVIKSMQALGVKNVIVVGAAANQAVVDELKAAGFTVDEVKGADRVATAQAINAKLKAPAGTFVVGYNGVADAMSVASYAAANNFAIVVANRDGSVASDVKADYIIGGTTLVKDIAGAKRLAGADRYETNKQVIAELDFQFGKVYVGNGATLADALVGSVLAAQTKSPIVLTDGKTVKADVASKLTKDSVVIALGGTGAVSDAAVNAVKNPSTPAGELKVDSVTAAAANAIKVTFNKAPADTSKVEFTVKNAGTTLTTTVNWNEAKTEATLAYSSNYPNGNYTVVVAEDGKELATKELSYEQQKVAKIEVTSTVLSVDPTSGYGYATYKVLDQYGVDITNLPLGNNIVWTPGVGELDKARDGVIVIKPGVSNIPLLTYSTFVINAYDPNSFVTTSATLSISQSTGSVSKITLNKLYSPNNDDFNTSNTTGQWYIDYSALDASGNPTTSYELISNGVLAINAGPFLTAKVVPSPEDSKKAAISVTLNSATVTQLVTDMQIPINVILKNGQTATLNVNLALGARIESIALYSPVDTVASEETFVVPFVAYDQKGKQVASYTKVKNSVNVTVSAGQAEFVQNADGSAALLVTVDPIPVNANSMPVYITATVTATGKTSQLNISVQKKAEPATVEINTAKLTQAMQQGGATQTIDFTAATPVLTVKDQYGRNYNMVNQSQYKVIATTTGTAIKLDDAGVASNETKREIYGTQKATVTSVDPGTQVVTFTLVDTNTNKVLDTKNYTFITVKHTDIVDYALDSFDTLYMAASDYSNAKDQEKAYIGEADVTGKLINGAKVVLASKTKDNKNTIEDVLVSNSEDFEFGASGTTVTAAAINPGATSSKTSAAGKITVLVNGTDGRLHTLSTDLAASREKPVAQSISFTASKATASVNNDRVTIAASALNGDQITRYTPAGNAQSGSDFYFSGKDQYGTNAAPIKVYIAAQDLKDSTGQAVTAYIDSNNCLQLGTAAQGTITLTATSGSGVSKTVVIKLK